VNIIVPNSSKSRKETKKFKKKAFFMSWIRGFDWGAGLKPARTGGLDWGAGLKPARTN
jgi:hypothetical protein